MAALDEALIKKTINEILASADRETIGVKKVRRTLKGNLPGVDIDSHKDTIDGWTTEAYHALLASDPAPADDIDVKPEVSSSKAAKRERSPVPNGDSSAKKVKAKVDITDEEFARALQAEFERGQRSTRGAGKPKKARQAAKKKRSSATIGSDEDESTAASSAKRPFSVSGFNKPHKVSDQLSSLVGTDRLSRPTITKRLWVYIKANNLQKPGDGRFIIPDEKLAAVFGTKEFSSFKMATFISAHLQPMSAEEIEQYRQEMVAQEDKLELGSP